MQNFLKRILTQRNNKRYVYMALALVVLSVITIGVMLISSGGSKSGPTDPYMRTIKGPKYTTLIESIDKKYYNDTFFLGCFKDKIVSCSRDHLNKEDISVSGDFLSDINMLTKRAGKENFDNCVGDGITSCYDLAIKNTITRVPDASNCESYEDTALRQNCLNESYPKMAISKDDIGICTQNKESYWLKYCQDTFNQNKSVKIKDITYCDKLSDTSSQKMCRDNYYFSVALDAKDVSICKESGDKTAISNCAQNFISQTVFRGEERNCNALETYKDYIDKQELSNMRNRCTMEDINMRLSKLDPKKDSRAYTELCNTLTDELPKKDCLKRVMDDIKPVPDNRIPPEVEKMLMNTGATLSSSGILSPEEILKKIKEKK